jgi:hypothetical protein
MQTQLRRGWRRRLDLSERMPVPFTDARVLAGPVGVRLSFRYGVPEIVPADENGGQATGNERLIHVARFSPPHNCCASAAISSNLPSASSRP